MADPMVIQTTPMVAAVPKDVPVSTETAQFNKKLSSKKPEGWISPAETAMISGPGASPQGRQDSDQKKDKQDPDHSTKTGPGHFKK